MDARFSRLVRLALVGVVSLVVVGTLATTLPVPVAALDGDSGATYTNPRAPGGDGRYTVTLATERNDTIIRNGLEEITLDFGADRDFSGDVTRVTDEDVEVYLERRNASGSVSLGAVNVSQPEAGTLAVRFRPVVRSVGPGDRIVVRVANVTNTEIAARDPQGVRSFAMRVTTTDPRGNSDGPVEVRYEIDPNATASTEGTRATNTTTPGMNATTPGMNATTPGMNATTPGTNATGASGDGATGTAAADAAGGPPGEQDSASGNAIAAVVSGVPMALGVAAVGGLGVVMLGVTYVAYSRQKGRSNGGPSGGRERL